MDQLQITGGHKLNGEITISGAKNAALPLMIASILSDEPVTLHKIPTKLADIKTLRALLMSFGTLIEDDAPETLKLHTKDISSVVADYDLVRKMRASIFVLGPLLARAHKAEVSLPGGCAIGTRPVDLHLKAMEALGAKIEIKDGYIHANAPKGLQGAEILFPKVSVGATENAMMAATLASGETILRNCAKEPEIEDLAQCLNKMGAKISGAGTDKITIQGVDKLHGCDYTVLPDRIEAGSYAIAACMTKGKILLKDVAPSDLTAFWAKLTEAGATVTPNNDNKTVLIEMSSRPQAIDVMTEPYPGYPTDLQAQIMALNSISQGAGMVTETIFENRFMHVPELCRLGANITVHGASALVRGVETLKAAPVMATDLRASMALVLAGLAAQGTTKVNRVYHLDRGYEDLENKLSRCGAQINRVKVE